MLLNDSKVSISAATKMIMASPRVPFFLEGPPGCGKTNATAAFLREAGYSVAIVDCQCIAPEDSAAIPVVRDGVLNFASHEKWIPKAKMAIILDEFPKASADVMNTFLPLIFGRPRRYQENAYGEDTIVVLTGNSAEFRAGDNMKPHVRNRIVHLKIADPTTEEARKTALSLGWDARVINWATNVPAALMSYNSEMVKRPDSENVDSYFGYDPRFPTRPYVSMRALETVSMLLTDFTEADLDPDMARSAFEGAMGVRATTSFLTDLRRSGEFIPLSVILKDPQKAKIAKALYDQRMVAMNCASGTTVKNWETILDYVDRMHSEIRDVYALNMMYKSQVSSSLARFPRWNKMIAKTVS